MEFQLYTSFPSELAVEWNALLDESVTHVPFLRYEYLEAWWKTRGGGEWPAQSELAIVTARRDGKLVGIAPLFQADNRQKQPALLLLGSIEVSDYLDLIVRLADLENFTRELLPFLTQADLPWHSLDLYNLFENSPTLPALEAAARLQGWSFNCTVLQQAPYIRLPGDWEAYLAGIDKKQRHEIRRKLRRAEEMGEAIQLRFAIDPLQIDADIEDFMGLMAKDSEKAAFLTPPMREHMRLVVKCAFEKGCLQLAFLEINGHKAAAYLSFDYLDRMWVYNSGIDPRYSEYSPGWVLLGYLLKWAIDQQRSEFDFMRGDEDYKYRFGAIDRRVVRVLISR